MNVCSIDNTWYNQTLGRILGECSIIPGGLIILASTIHTEILILGLMALCHFHLSKVLPIAILKLLSDWISTYSSWQNPWSWLPGTDLFHQRGPHVLDGVQVRSSEEHFKTSVSAQFIHSFTTFDGRSWGLQWDDDPKHTKPYLLPGDLRFS